MARQHVTKRAIIDDGGPRPVALDDVTRAVEITPLAPGLLQAARLPLDHWFSPWFAAFKLCAVRNTVAELARTLPYVGGWLTKHAPHLTRRLHRVEANHALPVLASSGGTDFQVGRHVVAPLVLWEIGLTRRVPSRKAAVTDTLGCQDLLAVLMLRLGNKDIFKGLCPLLRLFCDLWHFAYFRALSSVLLKAVSDQEVSG